MFHVLGVSFKVWIMALLWIWTGCFWNALTVTESKESSDKHSQ